MPHDKLVTYLGDHIASARRAVQLAEYLKVHGTDGDIRSVAASFSADFEADRQLLEDLALMLRGDAMAPKRPARWRRRIRVMRRKVGPVPLLHALESIAVGLVGRIALWDVFIAMTARDSSLPRLDYRGLRNRAREQHVEVESHRLRYAMNALPGGVG